MAKKVQLQPAYCMHARPYRESSQIVDMLTPDHGLIAAVHRGSRKQRGSTRLLFTPLLISWSGGGELFTLTHVESEGARHLDLPGISIVGMYLNELVLRLTPKLSPSQGIFDLYRNVVMALGENEIPCENLLRLFEIKLLEMTGHGLLLDREADHETEIQAHGVYRYDVESGPVPVDRSGSAWNILKGTTLIALQSPLSMKHESRGAAKKFMRGMIDLHLGHRPLRSREILQFIRTAQPD
ncbi:MAG: DNA repair protein RecO [Gammaproteobacteria bacterium]|nr:DNA repair protein RecO [Gammaproteobacteria bacterium]